MTSFFFSHSKKYQMIQHLHRFPLFLLANTPSVRSQQNVFLGWNRGKGYKPQLMCSFCYTNVWAGCAWKGYSGYNWPSLIGGTSRVLTNKHTPARNSIQYSLWFTLRYLFTTKTLSFKLWGNYSQFKWWSGVFRKPLWLHSQHKQLYAAQSTD